MTQDVTTASTEKITQGTSSSFVVATMPTPSCLDGFWSIWSDIAAELTSTVTIMTTTTVGAGAKETSSASLPSNDANSFWDTTPSSPTPATPIATPMTMTTEPAAECLYGRAATPEPHRHKGDGDVSQGSDDRLPQKNSCLPSSSPTEKQGGSGTSGSARWNAAISTLLPLLQCSQSIMLMSAVIYAFVKEVLGCARSRADPRMVEITAIWKFVRRTRKSLRKRNQKCI
jgi:hypothetical protein